MGACVGFSPIQESGHSRSKYCGDTMTTIIPCGHSRWGPEPNYVFSRQSLSVLSPLERPGLARAEGVGLMVWGLRWAFLCACLRSHTCCHEVSLRFAWALRGFGLQTLSPGQD